MSLPGESGDEILRRTFRAEMVRAVAAGMAETALATFAILIAVREYDSGPTAKAILLSSFAVGLIGSLFVVPLAVRANWAVNRLAAGISVGSAIGFGLAAVLHQSEWGFIVGVSLGFIGISLPLPLQTQYLRAHYPDRSRGRLFSKTLLVRASATIGFAALGGWLLDLRFDWFRWLLWAFAVSGLVSAACFWSVPAFSLRRASGSESGRGIFRAMRWLKRDREFRVVILASMAMGIGVLTASSIRVDYLVNPEHGLEYGATLVAILSGILPSAVRVASTLWWGGWFDRANVFRLRIVVNFFFAVGIACYFSTDWLWLIVVGTSLLGLARGGGEILWNLWVTKVAEPENVGEYMSVHTSFTGVRALLAPFIGFYLVELGSIRGLLAFSLCFVIVAIGLLWRLVDVPDRGQSAQS